MKIDKNSYGSIALVYLVCAAVFLSIVLLNAPLWLRIAVAVLLVAICIWQTAFFRVPRRYPAGDSRNVSSVADGKVVIIKKVFEQEYLKQDCIQISVYMNFFDVHANFWPVTGDVTYHKYYPGKHFLAFKPKASEENEHTCTCIRTEDGHDVFFKQLAGTFARRIVNYAKFEDNAVSGKQCGIIKFGSRIDMYVPLDSIIAVKIGDKVRACETILAELQ